MIPTKESDWTSGHATVLRQFLESPEGRDALALLASFRPALLDGAHQVKTLVRSGEVKGYELAITTLLSMVTPEFEKSLHKPKELEQSYPDLDDDTKWKE
jgi:hypothetical protein